jgi:hypothetical protein
MDAVTPLPDFDAMRREIEEARDAMRRAIEARDVPAIEQIFKRATHISADMTGWEARYWKEKTSRASAQPTGYEGVPIA